MNLAIHGIEANVGPAPADTFLRPQHPDLKADFVLANPLFSVSDYSGPLLRADKRWTFGISPPRAIDQIVDYNNEPDIGDAWSNSWASGRRCTPEFNNIQPKYWT